MHNLSRAARASLSIVFFLGGGASTALASGMLPATSVVIVKESECMATMNVTNSDDHLSLLHVALEDIPEDPEPLLQVTPPLSRVEAGKTQAVIFALDECVAGGPARLTTQRMKRVIFEGIPETREKTGKAEVGVTIRQNLPVIIHPKSLADNPKPWTGLTWIHDGQQLNVSNKTAYVVRLSQQITLLPSNKAATLPKTYLLPGESISVSVADAGASKVRLYPATIYGYATDPYEADIVGQ